MQVELTKEEIEFLASCISFYMKPLTANDPFISGLLTKLNNVEEQNTQHQIPVLEMMGQLKYNMNNISPTPLIDVPIGGFSIQGSY